MKNGVAKIYRNQLYKLKKVNNQSILEFLQILLFFLLVKANRDAEKCMDVALNIIGQIETPYRELSECPRNINQNGPLCKLLIYESYQPCLKGLKPGQNILVLYWFENVDRNILQSSSPGKKIITGIFNLRSPHRPNPIAAANLKILDINEPCIFVKGLDCLTGTKLLDIKPAIKSEEAFLKENTNSYE